MASTYQLEIVTPDRVFLDEEVEMTIVRTSEGDVGILRDHEPLVAPVSIGAIKVIQGDDKRVATCAGGFVSVSEDKVTIVTDAAEWSEEIDIDRAQKALERAKERLERKHEAEVDVMRARAALMRATNRIRLSNRKMDHSSL